MGFLDLFGKNKKDDDPPPPSRERAECDINGTAIMDRLFRTDKELRKEAWQQELLTHITTASFACGQPQVINGPDGFPYFVLRMPEPSQPFESFCIRNMKDDFLLQNGWGVVINPQATGADWVFSHGDIVNLHLNGIFYTPVHSDELPQEETLQEEEKMLMAQPSEKFLPSPTRQVLRSFLEQTGLKDPRIALVIRKKREEVIEGLAFNLFPEDFPQPGSLNQRLRQLSWFLPRHYVLMALPRTKEWQKQFAPL